MPPASSVKYCSKCDKYLEKNEKNFYVFPKIYYSKHGRIIIRSCSKYCRKHMAEEQQRKYSSKDHYVDIIEVVDIALENRGDNWLEYLREQNRTKEWLKRKNERKNRKKDIVCK